MLTEIERSLASNPFFKTLITSPNGKVHFQIDELFVVLIYRELFSFNSFMTEAAII